MNQPPRRADHAGKDALAPLSFEDWQTRPRHRCETRLPAAGTAGSRARLWVCPRLEEAHWPGNPDIAARVAGRLVDNAVQHGRAFPDGCVVLRLAVLHSEHLRVEVDDANPEFPDFDAVNIPKHPVGRGLWWVWHYRGRLTWQPRRDEDGMVVGKSVCAVLPLAWDEMPA